ncbi:MAG: glycoside hydrolase family 1 protein, partial [Deltaproteobacteria bacterium]|nr:glycoside hydrolase family 1 protein [Deltaproteobacteria bacterium]
MTRLPDDFVLGVSSSGHQIEGGNDRSDWWDFEQRGLVAGGDRSGRAADWWNRYRDDIALLRDLGIGGHRFGVEWSRVEPAAGTFDDAALDRYADMVAAHRAAGIAPYIALSHFTIPQWLAERGGWLAPDFVERLVGFAERTVHRLGRDVACYFTINEPLTLAAMAYYYGLWPPQHRSMAE